MGICADSAIAQPLNITLVRSNYNGYGVSCFGGTNGSIEAIVTGGTAPYSYSWSNQDTTAAINGLAAGYYRVTVTDADSTSRYAETTLSQPRVLTVNLTPYTWPNGYNVSCHQCYNGSIQTSVQYGVPPYTYLWQDAVTTQHRTAIGAGNYQLVVTDHNGCQNQPGALFLSEPADNNWDKGGNAGTDPEVDYLGTSDSTDLVFRTHGLERFRLGGDGSLKMGLEDGVLGVNEAGYVLSWPLTKPWCFPDDPTISPWYLCGNILNGNGTHFLGSINAEPLIFKTHNVIRMQIGSTGNVTVGTGPAVQGTRLSVGQEPGKNWLELRRTAGAGINSSWLLHNREQGGALEFRFQPAAGDPVEKVLNLHDNGKVSIGDVPTDTPEHDYRLYVQGGLLTEKVKVALKTSDEWSDHVFQPGYRLMPLPEVKNYIHEHGHLPGVPSASCMVEQGLDVVRTDAMLMEKVEELMLHLITMEERLLRLEQENARLRTIVGLAR